MPAYSNLNPPYSLSPGDFGYSFNNEAVPAVALAGSQFAVQRYQGFPDAGRTVRWQTSFTTAPGAISAVLQASDTDVDANYFTIDTSTATAGEARMVTGVQANFLRVKVNTATVSGGAGFSAKISV